jgi:hypothetical protein
MNVRYRVELSQAERGELTAMLSKGRRAARKLKRAQILLTADAGCSDEEIARTVAVTGSTVYRGRARWTLELLADAMVKLTEHESLSGETVRRRLAENGLKPWRRDMCVCGVFRRSTANMSSAWNTCSTSMPKRPIQSGR